MATGSPRCTKHRLSRTALGLLLAASTCTIVSAQPAQCPVNPPHSQPLSPTLRKTVVITDPDVIKAGNFSLIRTLNAIIESAGPNNAPATDAERVALLQSLLNSFKQKAFVNPDSNVSVPVDLRPGEAALSPAKLLGGTGPDGMRPIGLFNRLDLAPADLSHCGEHRIVYGKGPQSNGDDNILNRFFLIFEAALDNPVDDPDPLKRAAGCRAVAAFWDGLKNKSGQDLASALEDFYYKGLPAAGGIPAFRPVVHFQHYGTPFGQVRGNLFVTPPVVWQLREWRAVTSPDARAAFSPTTVKNNPVAQLYGTKNPSDGFDALKDSFKTIFVDKGEAGQEQFGTLLEQITAYERALASGTPVNGRVDELSATVGFSPHNRFNDFQSVAGPGSTDVPADFAVQTDLAQRIDAKLKNLKTADQCKITSAHILNRAGALSCGGCHSFSAGVPIAPAVQWPEPAVGGFVHIREDSQLSPALEFEFLPARRRGVERALQTPQPQPGPTPTPYAKPQQYVRSLSRTAEDGKAQRSDFYEAAGKLERQIQKDRAQERNQPGAYVTIRRAH